MNKRHPHNNVIESKLEQLPVADADILWNDMYSILDKKMPQKKERRRFIVWFANGKGLILLTAALLMITGSYVFFLSTKNNSNITNAKLHNPSQANKSNEDDQTKASRDPKKSITTASERIQKSGYDISPTAPSVSATGQEISNTFIQGQPIIRSEKSKAIERLNLSSTELKKDTKKSQFNLPIQEAGQLSAKDNFTVPIHVPTRAGANFDTATVVLESIYQAFLIATNDNQENSLSQQPDSLANKTKVNVMNINEKGFYAGIIVGVDMSSIHFKSVKPGSTMGLTIGYALNKKWSIESGLLWDTKRVYDDGSHFNPPGYTPTSGITIIAVNGKSRLYELPVNIKYTILTGKHGLFATAGLSSYLMRSENYNYEYMQGSQPGGHNYLSYTNETKDWFSVVNVSAGYTHKLNDKGSIRIEPYLKLPIKNIGVANMPIMSTGLNIGFTKPLRK